VVRGSLGAGEQQRDLPRRDNGGHSTTWTAAAGEGAATAAHSSVASSSAASSSTGSSSSGGDSSGSAASGSHFCDMTQPPACDGQAGMTNSHDTYHDDR
jgi:hypothetical protein